MDGQRYILMLLERMERAELVTEHMATHVIHFPKAPRATASSKTRRTTACAASSSRTAEPAALVYVNTLMLQDTTAHAESRTLSDQDPGALPCGSGWWARDRSRTTRTLFARSGRVNVATRPHRTRRVGRGCRCDIVRLRRA